MELEWRIDRAGELRGAAPVLWANGRLIGGMSVATIEAVVAAFREDVGAVEAAGEAVERELAGVTTDYSEASWNVADLEKRVDALDAQRDRLERENEELRGKLESVKAEV